MNYTRNIYDIAKIRKFKERVGLQKELEIKDGDSGVYIIYSIKTEWCYVGETGNLKSRFKQHLSALRNNRHNRRKLQEIYNQFGEEDLVYIPINKCPDFIRKYIESAYINYIIKLGLNVVNIDSANKGFDWVKIKNEEVMLDRIPEKYRIILECHKNWKFKNYHIDLQDYLDKMLKNGMEIKEKGFKYLDEFESYNSIKTIEKYTKNYDDFTQMILDYSAIAIFNDILGRENNYDVFEKSRLLYENDFKSEDLIYNIYKKIRENNIFRADIIKATTSWVFYEKVNYDCKLMLIEKSYGCQLKIENIFDLLYVYIIELFIVELIKRQ